MYINDKTKKIVPITDFNSFYIVSDFDRTISDGNSKTSWTIIGESDLVPKDFKKSSIALHNKYRPIELNEKMDHDIKVSLIREWFHKSIELFIEYGVEESLFEIASKDANLIFRKGAKEFFRFLYERDVPFIIISAGVENLIEGFLKYHNCYYDNIYISSNRIIFENGKSIGMDENIIYSLNKNEVTLPENIKKKIENRPNVILLGDQKGDLKMIDDSKYEKTIKVAFLNGENEKDTEEYKEIFDIVMDSNEGFDELLDILI